MRLKGSKALRSKTHRVLLVYIHHKDGASESEIDKALFDHQKRLKHDLNDLKNQDPRSLAFQVGIKS